MFKDSILDDFQGSPACRAKPFTQAKPCMAHEACINVFFGV